MNYLAVNSMERLLAYKKALFFLAICWTSLVTYFCLKDGIALPAMLPKNFDKIGHVCFHIGIVVFWFLFLKSIKPYSSTKKILKDCVWISVTFGVTMEICQALLTTTRSSDWHDVLANSVGAVIGCLFIFQICRTSLNQKSFYKND